MYVCVCIIIHTHTDNHTKTSHFMSKFSRALIHTGSNSIFVLKYVTEISKSLLSLVEPHRYDIFEANKIPISWSKKKKKIKIGSQIFVTATDADYYTVY